MAHPLYAGGNAVHHAEDHHIQVLPIDLHHQYPSRLLLLCHIHRPTGG